MAQPKAQLKLKLPTFNTGMRRSSIHDYQKQAVEAAAISPDIPNVPNSDEVLYEGGTPSNNAYRCMNDNPKTRNIDKNQCHDDL